MKEHGITITQLIRIGHFLEIARNHIYFDYNQDERDKEEYDEVSRLMKVVEREIDFRSNRIG